MTDLNPLYPDEIKHRVRNGAGCGSQIGAGWFQLVRELDTKIAELCPDYVVDQVKEKFGGLRYYIGLNCDVDKTTSDKIYKMIREAEAKSETVCEICGNPGENISIGYYITTRCDEHRKKT